MEIMRLADKYLPHYTFEDWISWQGRLELIDVPPIAMSPTTILEH